MTILDLFRNYAKYTIKPRFPRVWVSGVWLYRKLLSVKYGSKLTYYHIRWRWRYMQFTVNVIGKTNRRSSSEVVNVSKNSGSITPADFPESVQDIRKNYSETNKDKRSFLNGELAGYALNDALRWDIPEMFYSFSGLAFKIIACAKSILKLQPDRLSILELGCGSGALGNFLIRLNVSEYVGIDGNALAGRFSPHIRSYRSRFLFLNLQEPIELYGDEARLYFDIVCSFEVLEHIAESTLDIFLSNVRRHLQKGGLFICSASAGDRGDVHVTVRPREWWLERFKKHGLAEIEPRDWERKIAEDHPCNWTPERSNVFVLRDEVYTSK